MLKLWGRPTSTNTQRVLWALAEVQVPYDFIAASATMGPGGHISLGNIPHGVVDTDAYRQMNPNGAIPTIDDCGFVLWESNAIVAYLARRYAPTELFGANEETFARALQWMIWANYSLDPAMHVLIMHLERLPALKRSAEAIDEARQEILRNLTLIESQLERSRYLAGQAFSIADIPAGISTQRWIHCGLEQPAFPRVKDWLERLGERAGFRKHVAQRANHFDESPLYDANGKSGAAG